MDDEANDLHWTPPPRPEWLQRFNAEGRLRRYPGSPWFAQTLLRASDRAVLAELHPVDQGKLARLLRDDARFTVVQEDGYELLRSLLPPVAIADRKAFPQGASICRPISGKERPLRQYDCQRSEECAPVPFGASGLDLGDPEP